MEAMDSSLQFFSPTLVHFSNHPNICNTVSASKQIEQTSQNSGLPANTAGLVIFIYITVF